MGGALLKRNSVMGFLGFLLLSFAMPGVRAQTTPAPAAPIPSQIVTAKKVFVSNGGGDFGVYTWKGGPARTYNEFYAALQKWGRYELVSTPGAADLVIEIDQSMQMQDTKIKLRLLDPKTGILLWELQYYPGTKGLPKSQDKVFGAAIDILVDDLKALSA
jgi:hypothetical protein